MRESGFESIDDGTAAYYRPDDNTAIFDAHPGNLVEADGLLIGFDAIVIHPDGELKQVLQRDYETAKARKPAVSTTGSFLDRARRQMGTEETRDPK